LPVLGSRLNAPGLDHTGVHHVISGAWARRIFDDSRYQRHRATAEGKIRFHDWIGNG
jgi:hypothetical protein